MESNKRKIFNTAIQIFLVVIGLFFLTGAKQPLAKNKIDWMTDLSREPIHISSVAEWKESCGLLYSLC